MAIYSGFSHKKWVDLSIVMLNYQRVDHNVLATTYCRRIFPVPSWWYRAALQAIQGSILEGVATEPVSLAEKKDGTWLEMSS